MDNLILFFQNLLIALRSGLLPQWGAWAYIVLAVMVALEGPAAILLGAAAASAGLMNPVLVFFAAMVGNQTADNLWYLLGYLGKTEWIAGLTRRLGFRPSLIEHLKKTMRQHAARMIFITKLASRFIIPTLVAAGLSRVPWKRFFPALILAETLSTGLLVIFGYYTTEAIKHVAQGFEYITLALSAVFIILTLYIGRSILKKTDQEDPPAPSGEE